MKPRVPYKIKVSDLSYEQLRAAKEKLRLLRKIEAFEFEGVTYLGDRKEAVRRYAKENPSEQFYIWLCKNYRQITSIR